eukprot:2682340-Karenia_brevis.AAC.1
MAPPDDLLACFQQRRDNQIMGLELLSISLGLSVFENFLRDQIVVIHSDNSGGNQKRESPGT